MSSVAFVVLAAAALSMRVDAPQPAVLVGEPVKLVITWTSTKPVKARLTNPVLPLLEIRSNDGSGWRRLELPPFIEDQVFGPDDLRPGEKLFVEFAIHEGSYERGKQTPLFSNVGSYSVQLVYHLNEGESVTSNTVRFEVSAPMGEDVEILNRIKRDPGFLRSTAAEEAFVEHPNSPYLRVAGLRRVERRSSAALERIDPETKETFWHLDRAQWQERCARRLRPMADELLSFGSWGAFETDRLEKAADLLARAGDHEAAEKVRKEILERFPRSKAAQDIERARKEEEAMGKDPDDEPANPSPKPKQ